MEGAEGGVGEGERERGRERGKEVGGGRREREVFHMMKELPPENLARDSGLADRQAGSSQINSTSNYRAPTGPWLCRWQIIVVPFLPFDPTGLPPNY